MSFLERCTMSPSWPTWYSCENSDNFTVARIFLTFPPHRLILDWSPIKLPMGTATSTSLSSLLSAMTGWWFCPFVSDPKFAMLRCLRRCRSTAECEAPSSEGYECGVCVASCCRSQKVVRVGFKIENPQKLDQIHAVGVLWYGYKWVHIFDTSTN